MTYSKKINETINNAIKEYYESNVATWQQTANFINSTYDVNFTDDACRQRYLRNRYKNSVVASIPEQLTINPVFNSEPKETTDVPDPIEFEKQKVKLSDERVQVNALIRRIAREETIKEIAQEVAQKLNENYPFHFTPIKQTGNNSSEKEAILQISDWHYGTEIHSPYNEYDPEICKQRVEKLAKEVAERCALYDIKKLHIVNLGDMIEGRIHLQLRLNSRIDVVTQTIEVAELLANFISALSTFLEIEYYDTLDNHSRIEPKLKDSLDLESLVRVITWFLKERLKNIPTIHFNDNTKGDDVISFKCLGHPICAVHGDKDKPENVVSNMALMTQQYYDLALTAHRHHFQANEMNRTIMLSNSSLMGTDDFAQSLRFTASASQNLIIVTKKNVIDTICRINLE